MKRLIFIGADVGFSPGITVLVGGTMVGPLGQVDMRILPAERPEPAFDLDMDPQILRDRPHRDWEQRARRRRK